MDELRLRLNPGGALAFTFIDPHHRSWPGEYEGDNLLWRLRREQEVHVGGALRQELGAADESAEQQWAADEQKEIKAVYAAGKSIAFLPSDPSDATIYQAPAK